MRKPQFVALALWLASLGYAAYQGTQLPKQPHAAIPYPSTTIWILVTMPLLFFAAAPLWCKGNPFDVPAIRAWSESRYSKGTYESYLSAIRPLLLFAATTLVLGVAGALATTQAGALLGGYVVSAFFASASIGVLICRFILSKQGKLGE